MEYCPDKWVMVKFVTEKQVTYKILASWAETYLGGASWKLNSGCTRIEEDDDWYFFYGYSGSVYRCHKKSYGMTGYTMGVYSRWQKQVAESEGASMEIMPEETNFMEIRYE